MSGSLWQDSYYQPKIGPLDYRVVPGFLVAIIIPVFRLETIVIVTCFAILSGVAESRYGMSIGSLMMFFRSKLRGRTYPPPGRSRRWAERYRMIFGIRPVRVMRKFTEEEISGIFHEETAVNDDDDYDIL
jgi:hypothetical protein